MYIENGESYKEYTESDNFPLGYVLNIGKSKCEDISGNNLDVNNILSGNGNSVTVKSNKTVYCTLYFDYKGTGEKDVPYRIQYIEDLVELSKAVNDEGNYYEGQYFYLARDLDFKEEGSYRDYKTKEYGDINGNSQDEELKTELTTGTGWKPIGNAVENYFGGIFDGKNFTLSNIYQNNTVETSGPVGLFGTINGATIKNLTLTGINDSTVVLAKGGIVGFAAGTVKLENLKNEVKVSSSVGNDSVGGILGVVAANANLEILNSTNTGVISGGNNTGGIVGYTDGKLIINNCTNYGEIVNKVGSQAGGLVGRDNATTNETTITNSHNEGNVSSISYSGGLVGKANGIITITNSYNESNINSTNYAGGLVGSAYEMIKISDSYNGKTANSIVSGVHAGGLVGGSFKKMEMTNSYNISQVKDLNTSDSKTGGLVGTIHGLDFSKITNSYNTGSVTGLFRTGGLIGLIEANIIVDACYNTGTVEDTGAKFVGGLASHVYFEEQNGTTEDIHAIFINSYNAGNIISKNNAGGIVYSTSSKTSILNSYNIGNLNVTSNGYGIGVFQHSGVISNLYNLGTITGSKKYGIGYKDNFTGKLENAYYKSGTYASNNVGTSITEADMKNRSFVTTLNTNRDALNKAGLSSIDSNLNGYTLRKWVFGPNNYPILANEGITDLSGKGGIAESFGVKHDSEGITTSTDEQHLGHIDLGFSNQNFNKALTYVVRVKFNKAILEPVSLIGNHNSAGATIGYNLTPNKLSFRMFSEEHGEYISVTTSKEIEIGKWYTVIGTYDGSNIKIYLNGELIGSEPTTDTIKSSNTSIVLGGNPGGDNTTYIESEYAYATFSDALVFNRALTQEEIKANYSNIPDPQNKTNLLAWYNFRKN